MKFVNPLSCSFFYELYLSFRPSVFVNWWRNWRTLPVKEWIKAAHNFEKGDFLAARGYYEIGLKRCLDHPARHSARLDYAYCLYRIGDCQSAMVQLNGLIADRQQLRSSYLLLARIESVLGHNDEALAAVACCLELFPEDPRTLSCFIHIGIAAKVDLQKLEWAREQLITIKSELPLEDSKVLMIDTALADFEIRLGDELRGEQLLARVLATGKAPFEAIVLRAQRLLETGRVLPSRELLARAIRLGPRDPRPSLMLAKSYLLPDGSFEPAWAVQHATEACRVSSWQHTECLAVLAEAHEALGDSSTAELLTARIKNLLMTREISLDTIKQIESHIERLRSL